ncbi:MAG TPA: hypothetical protein VJO12_16015 [Stellaceae bacterium]|nr:hypothetical protein [Stellaceae bacterium]
MTAKTPVGAKAVAKSISEALDKSHERRVQAHRPAKVTHSLFQRMFRRDEPSVFHRCLAIHMHNAQQPSALK